MPGPLPDESFESTEGLDLLWELAAQPDNLVFHSPEAELDGMRYWDCEQRWPSVVGNGGTITVTVPRAGTFYPGVVVYDVEEPTHVPRIYALIDHPPGLGSYEMGIDGEVVGRFWLREQDNRERLFFLDHAVKFKGGERITIRTGPTGVNLTEDILLLRKRPPIRKRAFGIRDPGADCVERDGRLQARLTWRTTWPARCTIEYGAAGAIQTVTEAGPLANHRVFLDGLEPGSNVRWRIVAPKPDGSEVTSGGMAFVFCAPAPFKGGVRRERVPLRVVNHHKFDLPVCPVSSGVPFVRGEIGDVQHMRLLDSGGEPVPMQGEPLARWDDGSLKWALVSFQTDVPAEEAAAFTLEYGGEVDPAVLETSLRVETAEGRITVNTGPLEVVFDAERSGFPVRGSLDGRPAFDAPIEARVAAEEAGLYDSAHPAELLEVEETGPVRVVVHSRGHHRSACGEPFFTYEARFVFYADAPFFRVCYAWGNDREDLFSTFDEIRLDLPLADDSAPEWAVGLGENRTVTGTGDVDLRQMRHDSFGMASVQSPDARLHRADGWLDVTSPGAPGVLVAVRDFWQLYPKALSIGDGGIRVGICPDFPAGTYDSGDEKETALLNYYLLDGRYRVKTGVKKWHELLVLCHGDPVGAAEHAEAVALFQEPLIAVCPPEHTCGTGVFGPLSPAGTGTSARSDALWEELAAGYVREREEGAWYGMLNFGDVAHKGTTVWQNGEYDHHHGFLLLFARTADPRWYFLAEKTARHAADVDSCNYGPHKGAVYAHVVGHTGDYFDTPPAPYPADHRERRLWGSPDHSWLEGFCDWYCVSGDPTSLEKARSGGDYYTGPAMLNNYDFSNLRDSGWFLILTMGVYNLTYDPFLLNAMHIVVERVLERQTPGPRGWHRQMMPAHCHCTPRHRGACVYMLAILCRGLETYYEVTGDERVAEAIVGGTNQAIDEMWIEEEGNFAPTSCPRVMEQSNWTGTFPHPVQMLLFSHRRTGEPRYLEVARRLIEQGPRADQHMVPWWTKAFYHLGCIERGAVGTE